MECYIFETKQEAEGALAFIHKSPIFPLVGKNAKTKELQPDKQKTEKWADISERKDGKFFFPRLPDEWRSAQSQEDIDEFNAIFSYTLETFDSSWMPESEE